MSGKKWPRRWARTENAESVFGAESVETIPGFPREVYTDYRSLAEHQAILSEEYRLNAMGQEREAALMAKLADLEKKLAVAVEALKYYKDFKPYHDKVASDALAAIEKEER